MKIKSLSYRPWIVITALAGLAVFAFLLSFSPSASAGTPGAPAGGVPDVALSLFTQGLDQPIGIANAGDNRLFVIEQAGKIQIVQPDGTVLGTPFLDITDRVEYGAGPGNEQGLLGLAFDPDYPSNGYFYVNYTYCNIADCPDYGATANLFTRISRFSVTGNANIADPNSEEILLTIQQPYGEHNGGDLNFGPDGYLYIGMGDGGSADDPENRAQNGMQLLGKMLRIDVDGGGLSPECDPAGNYTIPADNPFVSAADTCNEIWQFGLRNPWRFSFDRLTGDMYIGDVGEQGWEEVDFSPASSNGGENWGWRCYEGSHAYITGGCGPIENYDFPIYEYEQTTQRCAVMGGYVYRGGLYPVLYGHYIFADYCKGDFWTAIYNGSSWTVTFQGDLGNHLIAFGENADGEIFITGSNGNIYHVIENTTFQTPTITPTGTNTPTPTATPTAT
ncbi:MAG TPA: PQQ-dependent sugar dehydrogenase, partial [Anaerolineales bacterium]|nr:PQQ-dependent sugar dehydrogenase [Anaerolineales bacterium]